MSNSLNSFNASQLPVALPRGKIQELTSNPSYLQEKFTPSFLPFPFFFQQTQPSPKLSSITITPNPVPRVDLLCFFGDSALSPKLPLPSQKPIWNISLDEDHEEFAEKLKLFFLNSQSELARFFLISLNQSRLSLQFLKHLMSLSAVIHFNLGQENAEFAFDIVEADLSFTLKKEDAECKIRIPFCLSETLDFFSAFYREASPGSEQINECLLNFLKIILRQPLSYSPKSIPTPLNLSIPENLCSLEKAYTEMSEAFKSPQEPGKQFLLPWHSSNLLYSYFSLILVKIQPSYFFDYQHRETLKWFYTSCHYPLISSHALLLCEELLSLHKTLPSAKGLPFYDLSCNLWELFSKWTHKSARIDQLTALLFEAIPESRFNQIFRILSSYLTKSYCDLGFFLKSLQALCLHEEKEPRILDSLLRFSGLLNQHFNALESQNKTPDLQDRDQDLLKKFLSWILPRLRNDHPSEMIHCFELVKRFHFLKNDHEIHHYLTLFAQIDLPLGHFFELIEAKDLDGMLSSFTEASHSAAIFSDYFKRQISAFQAPLIERHYDKVQSILSFVQIATLDEQLRQKIQIEQWHYLQNLIKAGQTDQAREVIVSKRHCLPIEKTSLLKIELILKTLSKKLLDDWFLNLASHDCALLTRELFAKVLVAASPAKSPSKPIRAKAKEALLQKDTDRINFASCLKLLSPPFNTFLAKIPPKEQYHLHWKVIKYSQKDLAAVTERLSPERWEKFIKLAEELIENHPTQSNKYVKHWLAIASKNQSYPQLFEQSLTLLCTKIFPGLNKYQHRSKQIELFQFLMRCAPEKLELIPTLAFTNLLNHISTNFSQYSQHDLNHFFQVLIFIKGRLHFKSVQDDLKGIIKSLIKINPSPSSFFDALDLFEGPVILNKDKLKKAIDYFLEKKNFGKVEKLIAGLKDSTNQKACLKKIEESLSCPGEDAAAWLNFLLRHSKDLQDLFKVRKSLALECVANLILKNDCSVDLFEVYRSFNFSDPALFFKILELHSAHPFQRVQGYWPNLLQKTWSSSNGDALPKIIESYKHQVQFKQLFEEDFWVRTFLDLIHWGAAQDEIEIDSLQIIKLIHLSIHLMPLNVPFSYRLLDLLLKISETILKVQNPLSIIFNFTILNLLQNSSSYLTFHCGVLILDKMLGRGGGVDFWCLKKENNLVLEIISTFQKLPQFFKEFKSLAPILQKNKDLTFVQAFPKENLKDFMQFYSAFLVKFLNQLWSIKPFKGFSAYLTHLISLAKNSSEDLHLQNQTHLLVNSYLYYVGSKTMKIVKRDVCQSTLEQSHEIHQLPRFELSEIGLRKSLFLFAAYLEKMELFHQSRIPLKEPLIIRHNNLFHCFAGILCGLKKDLSAEHSHQVFNLYHAFLTISLSISQNDFYKIKDSQDPSAIPPFKILSRCMDRLFEISFKNPDLLSEGNLIENLNRFFDLFFHTTAHPVNSWILHHFLQNYFKHCFTLGLIKQGSVAWEFIYLQIENYLTQFNPVKPAKIKDRFDLAGKWNFFKDLLKIIPQTEKINDFQLLGKLYHEEFEGLDFIDHPQYLDTFNKLLRDLRFSKAPEAAVKTLQLQTRFYKFLYEVFHTKFSSSPCLNFFNEDLKTTMTDFFIHCKTLNFLAFALKDLYSSQTYHFTMQYEKKLLILDHDEGCAKFNYAHTDLVLEIYETLINLIIHQGTPLVIPEPMIFNDLSKLSSQQAEKVQRLRERFKKNLEEKVRKFTRKS